MCVYIYIDTLLIVYMYSGILIIVLCLLVGSTLFIVTITTVYVTNKNKVV